MAGTWAERWERPVVALSTRKEISATPPATTRSASPTSSVALLREIRLGLLLVSIHLPISGAIRVYTVLRPSGRYVGAQCIAPLHDFIPFHPQGCRAGYTYDLPVL